MGKADRVLCIVLDGEPMAEDINGDPEEECLPLAARRKVDEDGNILHEIFEPGAADLRSSGDGEKDAILKIVAGLIGVGLDEIKQRDILARQRRLVRIASTAVFLAVSAIAMATYAFYQQREAAIAKRTPLKKGRRQKMSLLRARPLRISCKISSSHSILKTPQGWIRNSSRRCLIKVLSSLRRSTNLMKRRIRSLQNLPIHRFL